jgi:RimJ/RimL family protein N-acetyltransferase
MRGRITRELLLRDGRPALLRPLTPDDADLLFQCFEGYGEFARRCFRPHEFDRPIAEKICREVDADALSVRFLALVDTPGGPRGVGYFFLYCLDQPVPQFGLGVVDAFRGQGLGRGIMEHLLELCRSMGLKRVGLTVMEFNPAARRLYESCGFRYTGKVEWREEFQGNMLTVEREMGRAGEEP